LISKARKGEPERLEGAVSARGMSDAVVLLSRRYYLQATNVPYLGRGKQDDGLARFIDQRYRHARPDLATVVLERMRKFACSGGSIATVTPQNWLFLKSYKELRIKLIKESQLNVICDLGPAAFHDMNWWAARTALIVCTENLANSKHLYMGLNADTGRELARKPKLMREEAPRVLSQTQIKSDPDYRISINEVSSGRLLSEFADTFVGLQNGDTPRWIHKFCSCSPPGGHRALGITAAAILTDL
jgi:hypothetical protein